MSLPDAGLCLDLARDARIGIAEAVYAEGKTDTQLVALVEETRARGGRLLFTRLGLDQVGRLPGSLRTAIDHDPVSRTGIVGGDIDIVAEVRVGIVTAGGSARPVAGEAARTLAFHGIASRAIDDVGVAGLWRLLDRADDWRDLDVIIAVAGMEGALFSVLGGLAAGVLIAVPTSTGYGVTEGGHAALTSALGSCAPGIVSVNIDNGYGAACAAIRVLKALDRAREVSRDVEAAGSG
jgi:NCAIR mutase (PurE)-related protein